MRSDEASLHVIRNYFATRPVKKAYVFGSFARGEADDRSDIDLLVELDHTRPIGWEFYGWWDELEVLLKRKVDLVTPDALSRHIAHLVERDKRLIYARAES
ncbi:MAG TPA: nucleotidyltransferase domain-containing protein [Flavobacteriales bacterium]|jgi:predicted nucleotidyltransferase|nr:nucleotidyltransferase domain-containing protein [Flavobacteriales bacterium]